LTAEHPALDVHRVLDALNRRNVEFVLVGGLSAVAHGASRLTHDFDCLPERTEANLDRLAGALRELGAFLRVDGLSDEEARALPLPIDGRTLQSMELSTWRTEAGDVDVLAALPDRTGHLVGFPELAGRSIELRLSDHIVLVAGLDDVIASKEWADRPKDREALPELRQLRDRPEQPS
jgi:hypothetical protein